MDLNVLFGGFNTIITNKDVFDLDTSKGLWYFDPPYINSNQGENKYNSTGFDLNKQQLLIQKAQQCEEFIYSNHQHDSIVFDRVVTTEIVYRGNMMTSKGAERGNKCAELLVYS